MSLSWSSSSHSSSWRIFSLYQLGLARDLFNSARNQNMAKNEPKFRFHLFYQLLFRNRNRFENDKIMYQFAAYWHTNEDIVSSAWLCTLLARLDSDREISARTHHYKYHIPRVIFFWSRILIFKASTITLDSHQKFDLW